MLRFSAAEAQLPVETGTVSGHQVDPFHLAQPGAIEQRLHHLAAEATALQVASYHDGPEHGPMDPIAAGPPEAHQTFAAPKGYYHGAAAQHLAQVTDGPLLGPEGVLAEQPLQLQQTSGWPPDGPHPQPAQAWGTGGMTNQTDPHGGIQRNNSFCPPGIWQPRA